MAPTAQTARAIGKAIAASVSAAPVARRAAVVVTVPKVVRESPVAQTTALVAAVAIFAVSKVVGFDCSLSTGFGEALAGSVFKNL